MRENAFLKLWAAVLCLSALGAEPVGQAQETPGRIQVMKREMSRNFQALQKERVPPYYISYSIDEIQTQSVAGAFGAIVNKNEARNAYLQVNLRTGSPELDSSHELRGDPLSALRIRLTSPIRAPLSESPEALALILWRETDKAYRSAVEALSKVKSEQSVKIAEEDRSEDFSTAAPHTTMEKPLDIQVDLDKWANRIRKYTAPCRAYDSVINCTGIFQSEVRHKYFVDTEGTVAASPVNYMRLQITAGVKADDGMEMPLYLSYFGFEESQLPPDARVMNDVNAMIANLEKLRTAPLVDPYTGPAILSGKASGVFFHEILGHRLEGHRLRSESEGQTFKKKVGQQVLPEFMSVIFDPTVKELHGFPLSGAFNIDEEGTRGERVVSIKDGILKDFVMSRKPVERFPRSNGHARSQPGMKPVSRQSNLIVESKKILPEQELRQMLIDECRKQNKPFGLLFTEISGGATSTGRSSPNAFNVIPLAVYRVFTNGRPDEMVRGVDLIGTPLTVFGKIIATGSKMEVFNGTCGAESGGVPVSAVSPSILVSEIEVQKKAKSQEKPPILPPPPKKTVEFRTGGEK